MKKYSIYLLLLAVISLSTGLRAQTGSDLSVSVPLYDYPENLESGFRNPSMQQSADWSAALYDLGFYGIHRAGSLLIRNTGNSMGGRLARGGLEYALGLAFSYYGSELPIPLGVWGHEAWHGAVLQTEGIQALNGNSLFHRWDGTVYGVTDQQLSDLKSSNTPKLLYSYLAGVQYEINNTAAGTVSDFYNDRTFYKAPLYLYNAWYVYNYFRFSVSPMTDSVKVIAPRYEDGDPYYRDFAGADLTAWIYDMFAPDRPWEERSAFPDGEGVNRRVAFSELDSDGQAYLLRQKKLSLLNFLNPAIFLVHSIGIGDQFRFLPFLQYVPTHFGHALSLELPFSVQGAGYYAAVRRYAAYEAAYWGVAFGLNEVALGPGIDLDIVGSYWEQPKDQDFFSTSGRAGGSIHMKLAYRLFPHLSLFGELGYKGKGWELGNPYLDPVLSFRTGIALQR